MASTEAAAPAASPAADPTTKQAAAGFDSADLDHWTGRFGEVLGKPSEHINNKSPEGSREWTNSLFGCFTPIDTCLLTCCCPCVTFGRTHHRLHKSGSLDGYHFINASCILSCVSGILPCLPLAMLTIQRADVRKKYNLQGSCLTDMAINCCCGCCSLAQQDKEAEHWEAQGASKTEQYQVGDTMTYGPQ